MDADLDKQDMRTILEAFPNHVREAARLGQLVRVTDPISRIVIAGVGSDGVVGDLVQSVLRYENKSVRVVKEHALPQWVTDTTLVFIVTHSGDTPETLSMYAEAIRKKAQIVVLTGGGKLRISARESNSKVIPLPKTMPSRLSIVYSFFAILNILEASKLSKSYVRDAEQLIQTLERNNYAKKGEALALKLKNSIPMIYSGPKMLAAANRWKQMINENAKSHAFVCPLPDSVQHEVSGFQHLTGNFHAIFLRDEKEHRDVQKQFDALKAHLKTKDIHVTEISLKGTSQLNKLFSAVHLADWTTYFLALLHEVDPTPVYTL